MRDDSRRPAEDHENDDTVSLAPLTPEQALRALLATRPPQEDDDESGKSDGTEDEDNG